MRTLFSPFSSRPRGRRVRVVAAVVATALTGVAGASIAGATTGATGLPQPKHNVAHKIGDRFVGRFAINRISRRARIRNGEILIDYTNTSHPFMIGFLSTNGYDDAGRQSNSVANLYPFAYAKGRMRAGIRAQGSDHVLGRVTFKRPTNPNVLTGTLTLRGHTWAVSYRRIAFSR
jgi:hypothetical protein